jgi:putative addiction module component (TIGR02574 family)
MKTLDEVTREAAQLDEVDRFKLARVLLSMSDDPVEPRAELDKAWDEEIDRRVEELKSGKMKLIPLEDVKRRIEAKFRK